MEKWATRVRTGRGAHCEEVALELSPEWEGGSQGADLGEERPGRGSVRCKAWRQSELWRLEEQAEGVERLDCHETWQQGSEMSFGPDHVRHFMPG